MSRRFKSKKKFKFKKLFLFFGIILIFYIIFNIKIDTNFSRILLKNYFKKTNIIDSISNIVNKQINNPVNLVKNELSNYKINKKNQNSKNTFLYKENDSVDVYIYNSHQIEKYAYEYLEDYNIVPDVMMISRMLEDKLNSIGINTVFEESDIKGYMNEKGYNHAQSYIASRVFLDQALVKYPKAKLYIDLHRDAAKHEYTTATINNKPCAKILFVIGLENSKYQENLKVTERLNNIINSKYNGLSRGIMKKQGYGVNGVYNQDANSNVILLEMGGNENNIEELNNTIELIKDAIGEYINEKEK